MTGRLRTVVLGGLVVLLLGLGSGGQAADERVIHMAAIEPKGGTMVDKEPYPAGELPKGGGYVKKAPDQNGRWEVSVYQFSPATVVVRQGERVTLELIGINGAKHSVSIDRYLPADSVVTRGQIARVGFTADTPGVFTIHCKEHEPSMTGTLVVLPR